MKKSTERNPTAKEKIAVYEGLFHDLQMASEVNLDHAAVREIIKRICSWSTAHRSGNGVLSEKNQQDLVSVAFWKLDLRNEIGNKK